MEAALLCACVCAPVRVSLCAAETGDAHRKCAHLQACTCVLSPPASAGLGDAWHTDGKSA